MAIFHLDTKPIQRSKGKSSVAASAYRNAIKLTDDRTGLTFDYGKKNHNVFFAECFMIGENGEKVFLDNAKVWNAAEKAEKRKDGRTAREVIINLPYELTDEQRKKLVQDFSEHLAKKYKVGIDFAIHRPSEKGDQRNHHAHIMMTTRDIKLDKNNEIVLGEKTQLEWENSKLVKQGLPLTSDQITDLRKTWEITCNEHLALAGLEVRIDSRSYKEQGINQLPTKKLGHKATALEREGIATTKGDYNRKIEEFNYKIFAQEIKLEELEQEQIAEVIDNYTKAKPPTETRTETLYRPPTPFDVSIPYQRPKPPKMQNKQDFVYRGDLPKMVTKITTPEPTHLELRAAQSFEKYQNFVAGLQARFQADIGKPVPEHLHLKNFIAAQAEGRNPLEPKPETGYKTGDSHITMIDSRTGKSHVIAIDDSNVKQCLDDIFAKQRDYKISVIYQSNDIAAVNHFDKHYKSNNQIDFTATYGKYDPLAQPKQSDDKDSSQTAPTTAPMRPKR